MGWLKAAKVSEVPQGGVIGVHVSGVPVALYRLDGEVYATHGLCTHALAVLADGWVEDGKVECPLHQGLFDIRSGKALCEPLTKDLRIYAVKIEGDGVFVDLDATAVTQVFAPSGEPSKPMIMNGSNAASRVVIVGAGQAAASAIQALRSAGFAGEIHLIGEEDHYPYERPPLSKEFLLGKADLLTCQRLSKDDARRLDVTVRLGIRAVSIDASAQILSLADGSVLSYNALLLAVGGQARRLDAPGANMEAVLHLRTPEDAAAIRDVLAHAAHVGVVGGGFIGLELASAAVTRGIAVTIFEREPELMARLLPASVGRAFRQLAERNGVEVRTSAPISEITRRGRRLGVVTQTDTYEVDAVLVGVGMEPNLILAASAGCALDNGIVVDAEARTSVPGIWAAGDCAVYHRGRSGRRIRLESWHNAEEQGAAAGRSMAGTERAPGKHPWFWTDQFGVNIQMLGLMGVDDAVAFSEQGSQGAQTGTVYRGTDNRSGRLTGVVAFDAPQAIRSAREELDSSGPFKFDAAGAVMLQELDKNGDLVESGSNAMNTPLSITKKFVWPREGLSRIPDWVYTDQSIYEREVEKIFHGSTWNFVALECEIPKTGDFIRSNVGPTPVVVSRAADGSVHAFENRCAHRAAEFCRELSGNVNEFVCPYHQWSYDLKGNLAGVPFRRGVAGKGGMPADFKTSEHGPKRLHVATHRGVVFASYSDRIEPLHEYLGPDIMREFEATFDGRKLKLLGHYRHTLPGNWKLYHENLRDPYHATLLHTFLVTFGLVVAGNRFLMLMDPTGRHGVMGSAQSDGKAVADDDKKEMRAYKENMTLAEPRFMNFIPEFDSPWSVTMATIWPNLIVQREMNTLGIRHIVPTGPHEFIMKWTMFGFEDDDEEMTRHRLRQGNLMGPAGLLGIEDNEAIKFVQDGMRHVPNKSHLVMLDPSVAAGTTENIISESAIRAMYQHWRTEMEL